MALTSTTPIYLSDIQNEFNASSLVGAANNAGFPTPVSMTDFLGASNVPSVYTIYDAGYESPVMSGFSWGLVGTSPRSLFRYNMGGNGGWGDEPLNTAQFQASQILLQGEFYLYMNSSRIAIGLDFRDWEYGNEVDFRNQYSQIRVTYKTRRQSEFYSGARNKCLGWWDRDWDDARNPATTLNTPAQVIRELPNGWSPTYTDTYALPTNTNSHHFIGIEGYAYTGYRRDLYAYIYKIEALA